MSDLHQRINSSPVGSAMAKDDGAVAANGAKPAASGGAFSMEVRLLLLLTVPLMLLFAPVAVAVTLKLLVVVVVVLFIGVSWLARVLFASRCCQKLPWS